jgi:cholesterol oxidase
MAGTATADDTHFDAVIVGSGFGGSVMAYRLAEAGKRVLVLERGRRYPPGSFPRSPYRFRRALWDPSRGLYGMYSVWSFNHLGAIVGSGLGGGSLIYANVLLRKDPEWFVQDGRPGGEWWPVTRDDLDPHYDRAERMLDAQRYPFEHAPYSGTPRTRAVVDAAIRLGWEPTFPPQAITFAAAGRPPAIGEPIPEPPDRPNLHHAARSTCRLCGECDIGCNYGAKNTLDYTYLTAAWHANAEIRDLCEVRSFTPRSGGGYLVRYVRHDPDQWEGQKHETRSMALHEVTCDRLVLSAGTLGTTYLLLRNRGSFPGIGAGLGTHFSGNGDLLTLAIEPRDKTTGKPIPIEGGVGPSITLTVRFDGEPDEGAPPGSPGRGFYLQDAGYPDLLNWLIQAAVLPTQMVRAWYTVKQLALGVLGRSTDSDISAELATLLGDTRLSSGILPLLGMGREMPVGKLGLRGKRLTADWTIDRSIEYYERVREAQRELAIELGAKFRDNPAWHFGRRVITVHPLGGAPMGRGPGDGVVDAWGQVFGHPGLYVADGSVMPGPVGPNPSLTIAALADRFADGILDGRAIEAA